jgi:hypothetical protein
MRKPQLLFLALLIGLFNCCSNQGTINENWYKNEDEIISQLFWELIKPLPPFAPKDTTKEAMQIFENDLKKWIAENKFELYLKDSLRIPDRSNYRKLDSSADFDSLCFNLFNDSSLPPRKVNLSNIPVKDNFKINTNIIDYDSFHEKVKDSTFIGLFEFSHIMFNKDFSKACFYFSDVRGPESGGGLLICAEKKNDNWTIISRDLVWVS